MPPRNRLTQTLHALTTLLFRCGGLEAVDRGAVPLRQGKQRIARGDGVRPAGQGGAGRLRDVGAVRVEGVLVPRRGGSGALGQHLLERGPDA